MKELLFEIGTEEIPAGYIDPALAYLKDAAAKALTDARLGFGAIEALGTPRRLVLMVHDVAEAQSDLESEVLGPRAEAAFGADGQLTPAALGFLSAKKIDPKSAYKKQTPKGEVLAATIFEKGQPAKLILSELLPALMKSIPFPKSMRWESSGTTFARPVRWLLAILGDECVPFRFADVESGTQTTGHRFMSPDFAQVKSLAHYREMLKSKYVMVDGAERREVIVRGVEKLAQDAGGQWVVDEALLETVKNLVEYPWPLRGEFESRYLEIPREILVSEMREHQKYFAVQDAKGQLLPCFVVVAGSKASDEKKVADGNARVLRARFEDGSFYYYEDLKHPLESFVEKLARVQFQRELGSVLEKTERIEKLTAFLATKVGADAATQKAASRAAHLCKADLTSGVVAQFPELQGVMGGYYAQKAGEADAVAAAIKEHYWPRFAGDQLPSTLGGALVSLVDKVDTLVGVIGIGKTPKGNADPFALRRLAIALVRIISERGLRLSLKDLVEASIDSYGTKIAKSPALADEVSAFILARAKGVFEAPIVIVDGAMASGSDDLTDLAARIAALSHLQRKDKETFAQLAAAFKRAGNIVSKAAADGIAFAQSDEPSLLEKDSEKQLFAAIERTQGAIDALRAGASSDLQQNYVAIMQQIAALKPFVDRFFDEVMVMCDDVKLRNARLSLLGRLQGAAKVIADFTRIQI